MALRRAVLRLELGAAEEAALVEEFLVAAAEEGMRVRWIHGMVLKYACMLVLVLEKLEALGVVVEALTLCRP